VQFSCLNVRIPISTLAPPMTSRTNHHLDTYLLRVLHTLLVEKSVSRTAIKLGQSQPTISNTLKRLRELTGDAILVRGKTGMVPTERGQELLALAKQGLEVIERIAAPVAAFEADSTARVFHIATPDYLNMLLIPSIIEQLRRRAPGASLMVHALDANLDYANALENGRFDLVIGNWPDPPEHLHLAQLFDDDVVCMMHRDHPVAKKGLTLKYYLEMPHLAPTPYIEGHRSGIDAALAEQGLKRNVQVTIPYFALVPHVLAKSDLIFTTGRQFAERIVEDWPIGMFTLPFDMPKMRFYMLWHARSHVAPDVVWLRRLIAEVSADLGKSGKKQSQPAL
jgi:DNA-binding transcriptional LysR family regulator